MTNDEARMTKEFPTDEARIRAMQPWCLVLRGANSVTYSVAQVSKPAVSRISKSASALTKDGLPTEKSAIQQVWKPALRHRICARLHLAGDRPTCLRACAALSG